QQLGELVIATGADALAPEELAGALMVLAETTDPAKREAWAKRGAAMFRSKSRRSAPTDGGDGGRSEAKSGSSQPPSGGPGAA
ncbi:MAG: conjugal transfer protein TraD, partial [Rhodobacteraceae bacterium]|nr:conjugal transfer protein TraD [Paracoccaceae bacterium]